MEDKMSEIESIFERLSIMIGEDKSSDFTDEEIRFGERCIELGCEFELYKSNPYLHSYTI